MSRFVAARARLLVFSLLAVLIVLSAHAGAPRYSELRDQHPQVDRAVGQLPSDELHEILSAVSARLHSADLAGREPGSAESLPSGAEQDLVERIEQLEQALDDEIDGLTTQDQLVVLQVLSVQVFEPVAELTSGLPWTFCPSAETLCDSPASLQALDRLAQALVPTLTQLAVDYSDLAAKESSLPDGPAPKAKDAYNSQSFDAIESELSDVWAIVHGEPVID